MKIIKHLSAVAAIVLAFSASAEDRKELNVATEPSFAPFEYMDKNTDDLIGFDIDIINAICEIEGYKANIASMPFDAQIPAIMTDQIDVAISGFTITKERAKMVTFSEPYYDAGLGALVHKNYRDKIKSLNDLNSASICAQIGTSGAMFAQQIKDAQVSQFNTANEAFMELAHGGCIATINDKPVLEYYLATTENEDLYLLNESFTFEQYGIVTSKQHPELSAMIQSGLTKIKENGTYDKIYEKWFGKRQ